MKFARAGRYLATTPITFLLVIYLLTTSRWGSYLRPPGLPAYAGDIGVALACAQVVWWLRARPHRVARLREEMGRAPLALLVTLVIPAYALIRFLVQGEWSLIVFRDLAPYAYGLVAVLAFVMPVVRQTAWRLTIYAALTAHLVWVVGLPRIPGFPWGLPALGSDAVLLVARPDFDSAVMGIAAAYALNDFLRWRRISGPTAAFLAAFIVLNVYGATSLETRAGLLSMFAAVVVVVVAWLRSSLLGLNRDRRRQGLRLVAVLAVAGAFFGIVLTQTTTGQRLVAGLTDDSAESYGTIQARGRVWRDITDFVSRSPQRTAVGVGFGPNIVEQSGASTALEGSTYTNVRSPHNYILGTLSRLGVAGALLALLMMFLVWGLAFRALLADPGPVTTLAALVAVTMPIIAMLGVVLESPFGALPYFWAVGQLSADWVRRSSSADDVGCDVAPVPVVGAGDAVAQ